MGSRKIRSRMGRSRLGWVLLCVVFAACAGEEPPEPVAPYANYQPPDDEAENTADRVANGSTAEGEEADDFLTDAPEDDQLLADATFEEPAASPEVPDAAPPTDAAPTADDPLSDLFAAPDGDQHADAEPAPAGDDDLFGEPEPMPTPGGRYAEETAPQEALTPPDRAAPNADVARQPAARPGGDVDDPLAELFGDAPGGDPQEDLSSSPLDELFGETAPAAAPRDPAAAMQDFFAAMRAGDIDSAYEFMATPLEPANRELLRAQIAKMVEMLIDGSMQIEIVETRAQDDWTLLVARIAVTDAGQTSERVSDQFMVLQNGKWRVVPATMRTDPAIKPLLNPNFEALQTWYQQNKPDLQRQFL